MSKNKKKTNDKFRKYLEQNGKLTDQKKSTGSSKFDGFTRMSPTPVGEEKLNQIRKILNEKLKVQLEETPKKEPVLTIDSAMISNAVKQVKAGKFSKVREILPNPNIAGFLKIADETKVLSEDQMSIMEKLIRIAKSFRDYDGEGKDLMTDEQYDAMMARFLSEGNNPKEPTGYVPDNLKSGMEKVKIKFPTLHNNMNKAYILHEGDPIPTGVKEQDSIEKFLQRAYKEIGITSETEIELELSPKIDGVSVNGQIVKDMLIDPQSRGDEDSSVLIKGMNGLQVTTMKDNDKQFGIQYEMFVTEEDRKKLSEHLGLENEYVSCRHAASGLLARLSTAPVDPELIQYASLYPIMAEGLDGTYEEVIDYIDNFKVVPNDMIERKVIRGTMKNLLKKIEKEFDHWKNLRGKLSYAIDGMVITIVDDDYQTTIGREGRTNLYQIALKFDPANATSKISKIWLDTGTKGYRTIQLGLKDPVFLDGVRYDHVPVLSVNLFNDLNLRQGSTLSIHRVGDVIPSVQVETAGLGAKMKLPEDCPTCGQKLIIKAGKLYCSNRMCRDNLVGRLCGFLDKIGMEDYGESFVVTLIDKFNVTSIEDLFTINEETIQASKINSKRLEEFPEKLREAISNTKDYKIVGAMGIPGIGNAKAKLLLKEFSLETLADFNVRKYIEDQERIENFMLKLVGAQTVEFAISYVFNSQFRLDLTAILPFIQKRTDFEKEETAMRVGHTGFDHNSDLEARIAELGYDYVDGTSFDILVTNDPNSNSTKMKRARKKELPIFTVEEFLENYKTA